MRHQAALVRSLLVVTLLGSGWSTAMAQDAASEADAQGRVRSPNNPMVTLAEVQTRRPPAPRPPSGAAVFPEEFRSIDGTGNNAENPTWGSTGIPFLRLTTASYGDGASSLAGRNLASARAVSNAVVAQTASTPNALGVSDFVWQWGQFVDHDIDLTPESSPAEPADIAVPSGDEWFDPSATGTATIAMNRSLYEDVDGVRQQINTISAFIDGSNVYGSDETRAAALRAFDGLGHLATSAGNLLPFNVDALPNAATGDPASFFLAGDFRANEQVGLTSMHTLFVREHNFWADQVHAALPELDDEEIFQYAKAIVVGELQAITYREFLPALLGPDAIAPYQGYRPGVDASISNLFATAAYRFGHSMLSPQLLRLDADGEESAEGNLSLASAFFSPQEITANGIDSVLRGLASQKAQEIDTQLVDEVRNFLFGPPGSGGFDLASLNIQRGRDHGLPRFNQVRRDLGLRPYERFGQLNPDPKVVARLRAVYRRVEDIDAWVGGLAEAHAPGALVGPTWRRVLADQFRRLRDGDRFWYQAYLPESWVKLVEGQNLARIIRRNTGIRGELPNDPFHVAEAR